MKDVNAASMLVRHRLARRVRELRKAKGLTQELLAQRAGLSSRHVQKVEAALLNVTLDTLAKLSFGLDVDTSELLIGDKRDIDR